MSERISVGVYRQEGLDISRVVIVSALKTQTVTDSASLQERICHAITNWMNRTETGHKARVYTSEDFNIGDLGSYLADDELVRYLICEDVLDLNIEDVDVDSNWTYDTVLINRNSLVEEK